MWESYKSEFGKQYPTMQEENARFGIFMNNLAVIDQRNAAESAVGGDAVHGINKFTDLSQEEFAQRYLLSDVSFKSGKKAEVAQVKPLPEGADALVDWTGTYTTPVKDQGYCGSCWAFSATEQIESQYFLAGNTLTEFAPQQLVSCDTTDAGCNGGDTITAFDYVQSAGGMALEADYPYTSGKAGVTGSCQSFTPAGGDISGYTYATPACTSRKCDSQDEDTLVANLGSTAPVSICVDASEWSSYTGGVFDGSCNSGYYQLDHCVQLIGYTGYSGSADSSSDGYYIVRNSWGSDWGEEGMIYLGMGSNACGVATEATFVTIA